MGGACGGFARVRANPVVEWQQTKEYDMSAVNTSNYAGNTRAVPTGRAERGLASRDSSEPATADKIRARAYEIYLNRRGNGGAGDATTDWLQAELEINGPKARSGNSKSAGTRTRGEVLLGGGD